MFRITFDTKKALWVIQLSSFYGTVWSSVSGVSFETLSEAEDYVRRIGLHRAYRQFLTADPEWALPQQQKYQMPAIVRRRSEWSVPETMAA